MDAHAFVPDDRESWFTRNRWRLGMLAAAIAGGIWWRRARRQRDFSVGSVSERWLAEQAFDAGQRAEE